MLTIEVFGNDLYEIKHLVLDYNGTLARDGVLLEGVSSRLQSLSPTLNIHVISADTFGTVQEQLSGIDCTIKIINSQEQDQAKAEFIEELNPRNVAAIGNGRNDVLMIKKSRLGMVVLGEEGAAGAALGAADIVGTNICHLLDLLLHPFRLKATLRN